MDGQEDGSGLSDRIDAATRTRARIALRALLESNAGPKLRGRARGLSPRRMAFAGLGVVGGLAAGVLLAIGLMAYRLSLGPIALDSLNPRISQSLEERFNGDYTFQLGPTSLERGETGLGLTFQGVVIKDRSGHTVLVAPKGEVGLDLWDFALFSVRAKRLELVGVDIALNVRPDGALSISAGRSLGEASGVSFDVPATPASAGGGRRSSIFAALGGAMIDGLTSQSLPLDRLGVVHGKMTIDDATTGEKKELDDVNVDFDRSSGGAALKISARGQAGPWSIAVKAHSGRDGSLEIEAKDLDFSDILLGAGLRDFAFETDMPISFKFDLQMNAERRLAAMDGKFSLGAGYFKLADPDHEPMLIDEAGGELHWDTAAQKVVVQNVQIFEGATHLNFAGAVIPPAASEPAWLIDFASDNSVFGGERPGEQPIHIGNAAFHARYLGDEKRFIVDNFSIAGPDATGSLKAEVLATDQGPTLKLDMTVDHSPVTNLARLWPSFITPDVRDWCIENLKGGEIVSAALAINWDAAAFKEAREKRPVPPDSVHATFQARDVAAQLLPGAPLMAGMEGSGVLTGNDLTITGTRGYVDAEPGKRIQASDISFVVPDLKPKPLNPAKASARFAGGADALVEIISRDPLKRFVGAPSDFAAAKGHFDGKLMIDMKLGKTAKPEDALVSADVALSNVQLDKFVGAERFDQGSMNVSIDHGTIKITSDGKMFGADATITATKGPNDDGVAEVAFTLDEAGRAKRGFSFGAGIAGPIGVKIKTPLGRPSSGEAELDLSRVSLDNLLPGVAKPAGKPAKATFSFKTEEGLSVSNLSFDGGGASVRGGSAQFSTGGALNWAKLNQVRLSPGDDLRADVSSADSVWKIAVRGAALDARPVLKGLVATGQPSDVKNYDLDLKVGSILGGNRQAMNQVDMTVVRRDGQLRQMRLNAQVGGGALTIHREESGNLLVQGADAGALLKFCDLYSHMERGSFNLTLKNSEGRQEGVVEIKDFVLRNEPALRQLVAAGQSQAASSGGFKVDADVASFQKLTGQFSRTPGRIDLHNALIYDQQMGLTAHGFIDYSGDRVDLSGTFVPAYQVNNLITHVPLVGMILGGGAHEGLFALNYRISGPATSPNLSVNILSAVTPGFLRKIFGVFDGTAQTPDELDDAPATRGFSVPARAAGANVR